MSLLCGIYDENVGHKRLFLEDTSALVSEFPWLSSRDDHFGQFSVSLRAAESAPYRNLRTQSGTAFFSLGDMLPGGQSNADPITTETDLDRDPCIIARHGGYYFAGLIDRYDTIHLAADPLGLMPVYYWGGAERFCFSTSPNAFLHHPRFAPEPDRMAVAGILMTMHPTANRTIWEGVKRLPPGVLLRWRKGEGISLTTAAPLQPHDRYFGWPASRCQSLLQNTFNAGVKSLGRLGKTSLLLSGGLDSRLIAGCLRWHAHYRVPAVTLGHAADYEMQCAKVVARKSKFPLNSVKVDLRLDLTWAIAQTRLEGMSGSFVDFQWCQALPTLQRLNPRIMTGLLGDSVMGGSHVHDALDGSSGSHSFDTQFARMNRYGYRPRQVSKLLREPGLAESLVEELRAEWHDSDGLPFQKSWMFDLRYRQRHHIGAIAWRLSFGAWPSLPYVDPDLLQAAAGMAASAFTERRAQIEMLRNKFPALAAIPLDRGSNEPRPLVETATWKIRSKTHDFIASAAGLKRTERMQYQRQYAMAGAGWQVIRETAETYRSRMSDLFSPVALAEMLPSLDTTLVTPDPIIDGTRYKNMLGTILQVGPTLTTDTDTPRA